MKKQLLLAATCLFAMTGMAETLQDGSFVIDDAYIMQVSPDGTYGVSSLYGGVNIYNFRTGQKWEYMPDEYGEYEYTLGNGNAISRTGVVVGSTTIMGSAAYWKDGEWNLLPTIDEYGVNLANGITADGSIIVGCVAPSATSEIRDVPAIWTLNEKGTYDGPQILPYPEVDFSGRVPQYILGISISDDGKNVSAQVIDYAGMFMRPLLIRNVDNKWSYTYIDEDLLNKDVVLPPYPGEFDVKYPSYEDYMTADELEDYNEAVADWTWDSGLDYPEFVDYMTDEEREEYEAAMAKYNEEHDAWYVLWDEFTEAVFAYTENLPEYDQNNAYISPDGKYFSASATMFDPMTWSSATFPFITDVQTLETKTYDQCNGYVFQIMSDGTMLYSNTDEGYNSSYVILPGEETGTPLYDYIKSFSPEAAEWMLETMTHEVERYDFETDEFVSGTEFITGRACTTFDQRLFVTCEQNLWDWESDVFSFSYLITFPVQSIELSAESLELPVTYSEKLVATVTPANATLGNIIEWNVENVEIANVFDGLVTAVSEGETEVMASCEGKTAVCKLKVVPLGTDVIPATSITLDQKEANMTVGQTLTLTATVLPEDATNKVVSWETSSETIATVDQNGVVTALSVGDVAITATTTDGSNLTATCEIHVGGNAVEAIMFEGKIGSVYGIDGTLIASDVDAAELKALPAGIYIVICDGVADKYIKK